MRRALIVDPFSTGKLLAAAFRARGIEPVAMLSQAIETHYGAASFRAEDFTRVLVPGAGAPEALTAAVRALDPCCIVPGCESGVELADRLCAEAGLFANDPQAAAGRRDKFEMQALLAAKGLRSIAQAKVADAAEGLAWLDRHGKLPVVVKPARSAGSDNVWLCRARDEVAERIEQVVAARSIIGEPNAVALVQEYVRGQEYVLDAVSHDGVPFLTNACRYVKDTAAGAFLYREVHVLPPSAPEVQPLLDYHGCMLRALGIRFGASHAELMLTDTGPVLIECGARLHGGVTIPELVRRCCGTSPVETLVASYDDPAAFLRRRNARPGFTRHAAVFVLANPRLGTVASLDGLTDLRGLRSRASVQVNVRVGETVRRTVDLYTSPAWIALEADHPGAIAEDIVTLRRLEAENRLVTLDAGGS